jgi:hypothetical protein
MAIKMSPEAQQRALRALSLMIDKGLGIMRASELARSSRRSVKKYMALFGIKTRKGKGGKLEIVKTLEQRTNEFINYMMAGNSATASAKKARTTVRTMSRQTRNGEPIIVKESGKWVLNVYPLYTHSLVIYGYIVDMNGNIQGNHEEDGKIKSPNAPDIWWQIDFDEFKSTLPDYEVGEFWADQILEYLRDTLELPLVMNDALAERFLGNEEVLADALMEDRVDEEGNMLLSPLENILSRYKIQLGNANYGVDDNHPMRELEYITRDELGETTAQGLFQIFFVKDEPLAYPLDGPMEIDFTYNLREERL